LDLISPAGICAAAQLKSSLGLAEITIYDTNSEVGGTWLVNTYPGCCCDMPSHLYSFSFCPKPGERLLLSIKLK